MLAPCAISVTDIALGLKNAVICFLDWNCRSMSAVARKEISFLNIFFRLHSYGLRGRNF
jgi:predicted MarR family transcription regulator